MNTFRGLLIYAALCASAGIAAGLAWFLTTGTVNPPIWAIAATCIVIGLACDPIATALERRTSRRGRARRAHARTDANSQKAA